MQTQHQALWQKIEAFELDESNVELPFSKKLAKQNNWPLPFTLLAIKEYKKFIYLCCISPNGVSPSEAVDKVWHLHLTYTTSYWEEFCKKTLGKEIHHYPSKGGDNENIKYNNWYAETLAVYETEFGEKPPLIIWPVFQATNNKATIFDNKISFKTSAICFSLVLLAFIISALLFSTVNPFNLNGQEFLCFFAILLIVVIISTILILLEKRKKILFYLNDIFPKKYSVFQAIYFLYGKSRAIQTALIHLLIKNIFEVKNNHFKYNAINIKNINFNNPLYEKTIEFNNGLTLSYSQIEKQLFIQELFQHDAFLKLEQIIKTKTKAPFYLFSAVILIGVARMMQGVSNDKPVSFLFFEMLIFCICFWLIYINYDETATILKESLSRFKNDGFNETETETSTLQQFAQNGTQALKGFDEYVVLAAIFASYPVLYQNRNFVSGGSFSTRNNLNETNNNSSCGNTNSCGSGDGGGSSCGSSGCGGCGGGSH